MWDEKHYSEYNKILSPREVKQREMHNRGYTYITNLCRTQDYVGARYSVVGEILTFNYNTQDNNGKLITIKRKVNLCTGAFKDQRMLCKSHAAVFFDRATNLFVARYT